MPLFATQSKFLMYPGNTQIIQLIGLQDLVSGSYLNAATITATLVDDNGNVVSSELNQVNFTYVTASNGNYNCVFGDPNFQPAVGTSYQLIIDGNQGSSYLHLELLVEMVARQS